MKAVSSADALCFSSRCVRKERAHIRRASLQVKEQPTAELLGPVESERQHSAALLRQSVNLALAVEPVHTTVSRFCSSQQVVFLPDRVASAL